LVFSNEGLIVGVVFGVVICLVCVIVGALAIRRQRRHSGEPYYYCFDYEKKKKNTHKIEFYFVEKDEALAERQRARNEMSPGNKHANFLYIVNSTKNSFCLYSQ
jgi:hypothetical protein